MRAPRRRHPYRRGPLFRSAAEFFFLRGFASLSSFEEWRPQREDRPLTFILFEHGLNVKQVQRWLGHHSASFTLDTYIHLIGDELPDPLDLDAELGPVSAGGPDLAALTEADHAPKALTAEVAYGD